MRNLAARLAFDRTLPPTEAMGRMRDVFQDYEGASGSCDERRHLHALVLYDLPRRGGTNGWRPAAALLLQQTGRGHAPPSARSGYLPTSKTDATSGSGFACNSMRR